MNPKIVINVVLLLVAFGAGWFSNGWRKDVEVAAEKYANLSQAIKDRDEAILQTNNKLDDVLTKVGSAAALANSTANKLHTLNDQHVSVIEHITERTKGLNNEIGKLAPPSCVFSTDVGSMFNAIGETANSGRSALYRTDRTTEN